jgi:outer membrane protein assembly factor BamA
MPLKWRGGRLFRSSRRGMSRQSPLGRESTDVPVSASRSMRIVAALVISLVAASDSIRLSADQAAPAATAFVLEAIEVAGITRYTADDIRRVSGLKLGSTITLADAAATLDKMVATGLFSGLGYRYTTRGNQLTLTFDVVEPAWTMPVVFDNFVWFTDEELIRGIRTAVPSLDGTVPLTAGIPGFVANAIQTVLRAKGIASAVRFSLRANEALGIGSLMFTAAAPAPRVCSLRFPGASTISAPELTAALATVVGSDYSRSYLTAASAGTLRDMYRERGHWSATLGGPVASPSGPACSGVDVDVSIAVNEGPAYVWDRAEWLGNAAVSTRDLDDLMAMRAGRPAALRQVDDGLIKIHSAYGKQGYVAFKATYEPRLDEATRRAVFEVRIDEGPQFRMGTLEFLGIAPSDAAAFAKRWRLKSGDVYDASYAQDFSSKDLAPRLPAGARYPTFQMETDATTRVVNVRFLFVDQAP